MSPLHITNGDSAGDKLRRIVEGPVTITADVLHEGPAPRVEGDAWHDVRARFLSSDGGRRHEEVRTTLAAWDSAIADACRARAVSCSASLSGERPDVVLWFEHDLFDQLQLIRTLDLLVRLSAGANGTRVSLICIDRFPGVDRFAGLGQLSDDQLKTLIGTECPVTAAQYALAAQAWDAFRAPHPRKLLAIAVRLRAPGSTVAPLPFLGDALRRLMAEYPSTTNGLSRTEQLALDALSRGPARGGELFVETQRHEPRPFMGDTTFYMILHRLASGRVPLLTVDAGSDELDLRGRTVDISNAGRDVVVGRRDHVALNGIDLWRGGVHLAGRDRSPWRWDARGETLVS